MTTEKVELERTPSMEKSFDRLKKKAPTIAPVSVYKYFSKPLLLVAYASNAAVGAFLSQLDENASLQPIHYES